MKRNAYRRPHDPVLSPENGKPGCHGKRSYPSFGEAKKMAERTRRQLDGRQAPYRCRHCHHYHVGTDNSAHGRPKEQAWQS